MPKAILVIDMPRDCLDCPCYHVLNNRPICEVNGLTSLYSTNYDEERPSFCPLKSLPEKKYSIPFPSAAPQLCEGMTESENDEGWNACIDEIVGEESDR